MSVNIVSGMKLQVMVREDVGEMLLIIASAKGRE